jgi:hypothetical protein
VYLVVQWVFLVAAQALVIMEEEIRASGLAKVELGKEVPGEVELELLEVGLALGVVELLVKVAVMLVEIMVIKEVT